MITFTRGAGVEFLPVRDVQGFRKAFIDDLASSNRLELQVPGMIGGLIDEGRILLELFPNGKSHRTPYRIRYYRKANYRVEYDEYGDLSAVKFCYSFRAVQSGGPAKQKWVVQRVTSQFIESSVSETVPNLDQEIQGMNSPIPNPLGFVPYVEVLNTPSAGGELGDSDFKPLMAKLEVHDDLTSNILDNLDQFSTSPLITSHDAAEVTESVYDSANSVQRNSVAYASGFGLDDSAPTRRQRRKHRRLKSIIGGIDPAEDQFLQLNINPVPQDHVVYADQYERQLREALGGILERGIETATESRVVYGKVAATAKDKQVALFKYGLCEIFSFALLAEEMQFIASQGRAGLQPLGDRSVNYRVGAVFMPTADDTLKRSIVGRNLQRLGTNAKYTLQYVHPDKTEAEIDQMVGSGGLPSEYINDVMGVIQQLSTLIDPMTGAPIPDPNTGLPLLYTLVPFVVQALSYGQQFNASPSSSGLNTTRLEPSAYAAAANAIANANTAAKQQRGGVVSADDQQSDGGLTQPTIPNPGATVRDDSESTGSGPSFFNLSKSPILQYLGIVNRG